MSSKPTFPKGPGACAFPNAATSRATRGPRSETEPSWENFVAFLKGNGARVTAARKTVFERAMSGSDHFRADELAAKLAPGPRSVSRGTVYRTLALLVKAGFLRPIRDGEAHFHYEQVRGRGHHEHLVCEECGAFIEFDAEEITRVLREKCSEKNFEKRSHRLTVLGTCEKCRRRLEKKRA